MPSSRRYDVYNYLCWILVENSNDRINGENVFVFRNGSDMLIIKYDAQFDDITITDVFYADSGAVAYANLSIGADLEPYFYNYQIYPSTYATNYDAMGSATIYPQAFDPNEEILFSSYYGYNLHSDQEIASLMLGSLLINLESVFTDYFSDGFTIYDLGFSYLYDSIS